MADGALAEERHSHLEQLGFEVQLGPAPAAYSKLRHDITLDPIPELRLGWGGSDALNIAHRIFVARFTLTVSGVDVIAPTDEMLTRRVGGTWGKGLRPRRSKLTLAVRACYRRNE